MQRHVRYVGTHGVSVPWSTLEYPWRRWRGWGGQADDWPRFTTPESLPGKCKPHSERSLASLLAFSSLFVLPISTSVADCRPPPAAWDATLETLICHKGLCSLLPYSPVSLTYSYRRRPCLYIPYLHTLSPSAPASRSILRTEPARLPVCHTLPSQGTSPISMPWFCFGTLPACQAASWGANGVNRAMLSVREVLLVP
jgi:hypothetical protein